MISLTKQTTWHKTWPALMAFVVFVPMVIARDRFGFGLETLFLVLAGGVFLVFFGGIIYFIAIKEGIEAAIKLVIEALGGAILWALFFGFAGMVAWEIVVSVWRHFPQGW
jgi:hypothetical protein